MAEKKETFMCNQCHKEIHISLLADHEINEDGSEYFECMICELENQEHFDNVWLKD
jgi:hypothetical protein